jgi:hypothetical protein
MVDSKKCNNKPMTCTEESCTYTPAEVQEDTLFYDQTQESHHCSFHKKRIISEKEDSQLFFNTAASCKYNDLYCVLYDSIVAWENNTTSDCLLTKIHFGSNYTTSNKLSTEDWALQNVLYSNIDGLTFQITGVTHECGVRLYKTTDDLLVLLANDHLAQDHQHIEVANEKTTFNRQHDINNLMLAESDAEKYNQWRRAQERVDLASYKECQALSTQLQLIAKEQDSFNTIHDLNGNEIITYSSNNLIHIPVCQKVNTISLRKTNECYEDFPITLDLNNKRINAFLTKNNFIKRSSQQVNCKIINQAQLLPGNELILLRKGPTAQVNPTKGVIFIDLAVAHHQHERISLAHHEQIIGSYESAKSKEASSSNDDIEGKYYALPNDKQITDVVYRSSITTAIDDIKDTMMSSISHSTITNAITSTIIAALLIYSITQIIIAAVQYAKANRKATTNTFTRNQPTRITIIDPKITEIISKYRSPQLV